MPEKPNCVLAIDPGTAKCGMAVVRRDGGETTILHRSVLSFAEAQDAMRELARLHCPDLILVGNGTMSREYLQMVERLKMAPARIVDEKSSTLAARKLYFDENPPRGIRRIIPTSMQTPSVPYDDYVAVILARTFLASSN